jgi:S1-C subfamily serine protease
VSGRPTRRVLGLIVPAVLGPAAIVLVACAGSDDDAPTGEGQTVVTIESQTCRRPQPRVGVGTVLGDGVALTAAHVVDDQLRRLEVDGRPARVVASSAAADLALVASETSSDRTIDAARRWFDTIDDVAPVPIEASSTVTIVTASGLRPTTVERVVDLRVDDVSAGVVHERRALVLAADVRSGDSGSPVVDGAGDVVGVVVLRRPDESNSYASRVPPLPTPTDLAADQPRSATSRGGSAAESVAPIEPCT